ncbi:NUDIX domain-containing protein [Bacillus mangrovi]|uniref:NUDIX domain-containing protein n=1 Tax=Metabacillus mangrovi TaxID=1491830 RepID=A0A7X2S5E6_9BACI|nr:NUDIX domain-containing protein [Metabacillus mangrovi]MTH54033.1 NUDIX domain-containing protein [Metabacillus mangrovi]
MEYLKVLDEKGRMLGTASRDEIHEKGWWHETFHCWMIEEQERRVFLYFQLRSASKKDYPDLYDITSAGHLLADETPEDGVREIEEELGLKVAFQDLEPLGVIPWTSSSGTIIDRELAHVFLYRLPRQPDFVFQEEEVAGVVKADINEFQELILGDRSSIQLLGETRTCTDLSRFVPHPKAYYAELFKRIGLSGSLRSG